MIGEFLRENYGVDRGGDLEECGIPAFLLDAKSGDSYDFASAFAVLARINGLPTRILRGYTGETSVNLGSGYTYWPEVLFKGALDGFALISCSITLGSHPWSWSD